MEALGNTILFLIGIGLIGAVITVIVLRITNQNKIFSSPQYKYFVSQINTIKHNYDAARPMVRVINVNRNSKAQVERFNHEQHLMLMFSENNILHTQYAQMAVALQTAYNSYICAYRALVNQWNSVRISTAEPIRNRIDSAIKNAYYVQNAQSVALCKLVCSYTSPQARTRCSNAFYLTVGNFWRLTKEINSGRVRKQRAEYERSLMTDKLRYQILCRDKHRCVICGATQNDGVKLHVDHILPIYEGGKTTYENLRTLCERCNLGKGKSYDYTDGAYN
ncbi:MAG: HNH endonuclease [Oscillospiraceae bacterium]|jgi:5-methylcytosine-specific restriction endonuclease McrA|nr:HNH endonuclease [Oscillospiraceae bacterium]